jgi:hypothetical protein
VHVVDVGRGDGGGEQRLVAGATTAATVAEGLAEAATAATGAERRVAM